MRKQNKTKAQEDKIMKKMTKTIALLALSVLMLMCVCACGKKGGEQGDALEGTWYFQSPDYGDVTATFDGKGKMTWGYDCGFTVMKALTSFRMAVRLHSSLMDGQLSRSQHIR